MPILILLVAVTNLRAFSRAVTASELAPLQFIPMATALTTTVPMTAITYTARPRTRA